MLAHAFLAGTAAHQRSRTSTTETDTTTDNAKIPLTCDEVRHVRAALTRPTTPQTTSPDGTDTADATNTEPDSATTAREQRDHDLRL